MELGIYTFAEVHPAEGETWTAAAARRMGQLLEEAELADRLGLEVFGVGEHHRPDFAGPRPPWPWQRSPRARTTYASRAR
jgi:alkanesulfonate monooxygenase SsuD/methylene tetrahydromethanopterin reductase-like flavin-dependent oxidoreductase (luciferase family)